MQMNTTRSSLIALIVLTSLNSVAQDIRVAETFKLAEARFRQTVESFGDSVRYVKATLPDGSWKVIKPREWTSGFLPGALWYIHQYTRDPFFADAADRYTRGLEGVQTYGGTHDLGFIMFCSYGNGYLQKSNDNYKSVLLQTAKTLVTRYNPKVGCIKSWDNPRWMYPVIVDNMMNLELLFWAAQNGGPKAYYDIAVSHAERTMKNHIRADGSTFHVVSYDTTTGGVIVKNTHQGYADSSAWSRGQAWGIYGFTMTYRFTRDGRFLETAQRLADYFIAHLPEDKVPYWDFLAPNIPNEPRDASAAAIAASGLLELSTYGDAAAQNKYRQAAFEILSSLTRPPYLAEDVKLAGILNHSITSKPANSEVDVDLIYGDYYLLEALLRSLALEPKK
jgi:unsaturated chondroitin disaccharide hydrolase